MASVPLTTEEEQSTKQFLETLNTQRTEQNASPVPWTDALRFLRARKFDVKRAIDLFYRHEEVRIQEGIYNIDPAEESVKKELVTGKFTILSGRDREGATLALFTARLHYPTNTTHRAVLKSLIFQLDGALESADTQRNGLVFVYDMSSSKYTNFDYDLSTKILTLLKGSYPAKLKKVLIVTAPLWFKAPFKILRLFIREKLRDRVYTVSLNQLQHHIPMNSLPKHLGGHAEVQHRKWLSQCVTTLQSSNSKLNNEVSAYFEDINNYNSHTHDLSVSGISSMSSSNVSAPTTPNGDDSCFYSNSDMESDISRDTLMDRSHTDLGSEKEVSVEKDFRVKNNTFSNKSVSQSRAKSPPLKRTMDTMENATDEEDLRSSPIRKRSMSIPDYEMEEECVHVGSDRGMGLKDLVEYVKSKGKDGLYQEYAHIKGEPPKGTFEVSKLRYNSAKNRYTDVLCLDQSRVKLSPREGDPSSDYINANFVDSYKHKNAYITTQGPLERTFGDFWRLVWEQRVLVIVMTTRTVERSRLKCGQYWPKEEESAEEYGDFVVVNNDIVRDKDYTVSHLEIQNIKTQETRKITHFQFTSWPDFGVPPSAGAFLSFMFHVREHQAERVRELGNTWTGHPLGPPILVHCSAGIGRTGTFITMNINTLRLSDNNTVEVKNTVTRLRNQRAFSIQTPDQYVFCHTALIEHAQNQGLLSNITDVEALLSSTSDSD